MADSNDIEDDDFVRADVAIKSGDLLAAKAILERLCLTAGSAKKARASRRLAEVARRRGDLALAEQSLKIHLAEFPNDTLARRELARFLEARDEGAGDSTKKTKKYWEKRKDYVYLYVTRIIAQKIGSNANVLVDVGSNGTPILEWFPDVPVRYSVDLHKPYRAPGIRSVKGDFLAWEPRRKVNVLTCFQVMEHIPEVALVAQKMLHVADVCIVSVPYKWPKEAVPTYHIHDPVDEEKMLSWFEREPNYSYLATEIFGEQRLIAVYDRKTTDRWSKIDASDFRFRWSLRGAEDMTGASLAHKSALPTE